MDPIQLAAFIAASERLTGVSPLDGGLASGYLDRLVAAGLSADVAAMVAALGAAPATEDPVSLLSDGNLRETAARVAVLWYTAELPLPNAAGPAPEQHFGGLLWPLIGAHPPALAGGYFGHWSYPPDSELPEAR